MFRKQGLATPRLEHSGGAKDLEENISIQEENV